MRIVCTLAAVLAIASSGLAAPNVTNATQKGSLLIWPDIRVDGPWNTLVRISNDGSQDVDVICYWMDGNKNRVDLIFTVTKNQPFWFDAKTGTGTSQVNRFPLSPANGFDNPFLFGPAGPYGKGLLACWAVDGGAQNQVKWNHLSGTATVYVPGAFAYAYNAYAFFVPTGLDLEPIGNAGTLNLNGVEYDSCPLYQIGQFSPIGATEPVPAPGTPLVSAPTRLALTGCTLNLQQDWTPVYTKYQFDIWNEDEVKFTGAFECADSWHELDGLDRLGQTAVPGVPAAFSDGTDSASQNFQFATLGTFGARYRVQGIKSTQCERPAGTGGNPPAIVTQNVGVIGVQSAFVPAGGPGPSIIGSTLAAAGKFTGKVVWDPEGAVPEGGIR